GTAADEFVSSEVCKITYLQQFIPTDTFLNVLANACPGQRASNASGNRCSIQRFPNDNNIYFVNGSTHIPIAALFVPINRAAIGPGHFYSAATDGPGPAGNIYAYEDFRASAKVVTIRAGSNGKAGTYKCDDGLMMVAAHTPGASAGNAQ